MGIQSKEFGIEDLFFIQDSRTYCGNAVMWWRPEGNGYTSNVNEAWRVPEETAKRMHRNRPTDVPWPVAHILAGAFPIFDMQYLRQPRPAPPDCTQKGE